MILLRLYFEFFKTGLFAVGGGLATIPFLRELGAATNWFTDTDLTTMLAVSESTPGPIGVNMATYAGFTVAGVPGAVIATLGLITPSIMIILAIAGILSKFRQSKAVNAVFLGLRPASTALIVSAGLSVAASVLIAVGIGEDGLSHAFSFRWELALLAAAVFMAMNHPKLKKIHPIVFIGLSALTGVLFRF